MCLFLLQNRYGFLINIMINNNIIVRLILFWLLRLLADEWKLELQNVIYAPNGLYYNK